MRVATSTATLRTRLEAAETAYDAMMVEGRGVVEYQEPGGLRVRKDPREMREYIRYLQEAIASRSSASTTTLASFRRPR